MSIVDGTRSLAEGGLNLVAVLDCASLTRDIPNLAASSGAPLADYGRLVLIGHGGRRMWDALQNRGMKTTDPVDQYSMSLTQGFIRDCLGDARVLWLYPGDRYPFPLQRLGETAGWSHPSPLGTGINPVYGVWFAYRSAFLTDAELPLIHEAATRSPCNDCAEKPCVRTCPADAVQENGFDLDGCASHRLSSGSPCADRCLARLACPFFPEHRYSLGQIQYHYQHSLATLRAYRYPLRSSKDSQRS